MKCSCVHNAHRKRMRDKYEKLGADVFDTHQLVEMLLFHAVRRVDTNPTAHELLNAHPDGAFGVQSSNELCDVNGIGPNSAELLRLSADTSIRLLCERLTSAPMVSDFTVQTYFWLWFKNKPRHTLCALLLDSRDRYMDCCILTAGAGKDPEDYALALSEIIKARNPASIILAHNHKSNVSEASLEDIYLTAYLKKQIEKTKCTLRGHYIVTDADCISCPIKT